VPAAPRAKQHGSALTSPAPFAHRKTAWAEALELLEEVIA